MTCIVLKPHNVGNSELMILHFIDFLKRRYSRDVTRISRTQSIVFCNICDVEVSCISVWSHCNMFCMRDENMQRFGPILKRKHETKILQLPMLILLGNIFAIWMWWLWPKVVLPKSKLQRRDVALSIHFVCHHDPIHDGEMVAALCRFAAPLHAW